LLSLGGAPDSVIADFDRTAWQDVLEEPVEELVNRERDMADLLRAIVAVTETDLALVEGFQPAIGNGDAEEVTAQIVEDLFTAPCGLSVNNPRRVPQS
jgi:hypothetical protein